MCSFKTLPIPAVCFFFLPIILHLKPFIHNKFNHKRLLLTVPEVPGPCEPLLDTESAEWSQLGRAGGGTASDFSDRFSLSVLRTTVKSSWLRINCWKQAEYFKLFLHQLTC